MTNKKVIYENESVEFSNQGLFDIILGWNGCENAYVGNYDLCVFYRKKDKSTGGVFSREFTQQLQSEGSLWSFPYIYLMGDGRAYPHYTDEEIVRITNIHDMEEVCIVAVDYNAAIEDENGFDLPVTLETERTNPLTEIIYSRTSDEHGVVLLLATLKELENGEILITNKSMQMSLQDAFEQIPGFSHICKQ